MPHGVQMSSAMPPELLAIIGIEEEDVLDFSLAFGGRTVLVQLLITMERLTVNRLVSDSEAEALTAAETSEVMTWIFTDCLHPAFQMCPGTTMVVRDADSVKHIQHG